MTSSLGLITVKIKLKYIVILFTLILILSLSLYRLKVNSEKHERIATVEDFRTFLTSKPYVGFDSSSYKEDIQFYFSLFEQGMNADWGQNIWHRNNIWPLWLNYKHRHVLVLNPYQ